MSRCIGCKGNCVQCVMLFMFFVLLVLDCYDGSGQAAAGPVELSQGAESRTVAPGDEPAVEHATRRGAGERPYPSWAPRTQTTGRFGATSSGP